ncbi:hypothetical protein EB796_017480 [Bugula neritina]|uniref:Uncharacterized protein n=1 Tax=Bugula neritina TaxID=10212 RepID=A0A7J7JFT8_BUGNE|nr:hypothetical protein EB796_017480 [Bugula neritina]
MFVLGYQHDSPLHCHSDSWSRSTSSKAAGTLQTCVIIVVVCTSSILVNELPCFQTLLRHDIYLQPPQCKLQPPQCKLQPPQCALQPPQCKLQPPQCALQCILQLPQ